MSRRPNYGVWINMFRETMATQSTISPRGAKIRELEDYQFTIDPMYPFMNFEHRNLNIDYFRKEMRWKLGADRFDKSICEHAKMWASVMNTDGSFNSNYGQYWFGEQLGMMKAINELIRDIDSRRAVIPMLQAGHIGPHVKDSVCTEAIGFRIRDGRLNCSVHMRSSDQIFGLGTDIPTFSFLQRLVLGILQTVYPYLTLGNMTITAMSSHIYERHFDMVTNILQSPTIGHCSVMPIATTEEAFKIAASAGKVDPNWGPLSEWLQLTEG